MNKAILIFGINILCAPMFFSQDKNLGINIDLMDKSQKPQDDFYNYVNGTWMKKVEIPSDRVRWGSFDELREKTDLKALEILKKSMNENHSKGTDGQKIKDLYASIMDLKSRNEAGVKPIIPILSRIDRIENMEDLQRHLADVTPIGENPFYSYGVYADMKNSNMNAVYFGGPDLGLGRDYYQKDDEKSKQTLSDYAKYIDKITKAAGYSMTQERISNLIAFEKSMAKSMLTVEEIRNDLLQYNPTSVNDLGKISNNINLKQYLTDCGVKTDSVIISEIKYLKSLDEFLNEKDINTVKDFMKFSVINGSAGMLSEELDEIRFDFYGRTMRGQKEQRPLEKRALQTINGSVGEILGKLYVAEAFPPEAKAKASEMIDYIKKSFKKHIENLTWMSAQTKTKALEKLSKFTVKIGYPDKWKDYSKLNIESIENSGSYYGNMANIRQWNYLDDLSKVGQPVDKTEWGMSPQTVNAYYNPLYNEIVFPAAILQAPFYDYRADVAVNFGGIGAVIGHEISHGFDDSGSLYDANGNLNNWWTEQDKANFEKAGNALAEQYSKFEPLPNVFVNGKFTLGENIADLGGVSVAYDALNMYLKDKGNINKIDGYTQEQRFFLSWATIWRTKSTDKALADQVKTDPHSPGYFRAIGPLMNFEPFYKAFGVKQGDKMYKEQTQRITIW